jgi:hypothetical protein
MPLSWVFAIELKDDDTLTLHVRVNGFAPDIPVEISGYVTQSNGAVASFYDIQNMPTSAGDADMDVINVQAASAKFDPELPFTVITRAADVWISKLTKNQSVQTKASSGAGGIQAAWNSPQEAYHSALFTKTTASVLGQSSASWQPGPPAPPAAPPPASPPPAAPPPASQSA